MANERTYPCLPCRDLDEAIAFYAALGFARTYRQLKPNPYAVVAREEIQIHLFGMDGFNPAESYGSVIVVVPDPDALYHSFARGLRAAYHKLPVSGIPRITRPRKKFGTVYGFSVVDVGGNWLRVSKLSADGVADRTDDNEAQDTGETGAQAATGLAGIIAVAARLGDAHGDDARALKTLEQGLTRYADAPTLDVARALLYRAELAVRMQETTLAQSSLAQVASLDLTDVERTELADEIAHIRELIEDAR